ncbi:MAG: ABC transporter ATP-binding protein [Anaerolineales bacterium]
MTDLNSITIENLHKKFEDIKALDGLSFKVNAGEMFIIVGPDGAGKSTLLRILAGILPFEEGHVQAFDRTLPGDEEKIKLKLGYMPQRFGLYEDLTVHENLKFFYSLYNLPRRNRDEVFRRMFEFSGLERFKKRLAGDLSGGMKQKLGLSCALLHKPSLLGSCCSIPFLGSGKGMNWYPSQEFTFSPSGPALRPSEISSPDPTGGEEAWAHVQRAPWFKICWMRDSKPSC